MERQTLYTLRDWIILSRRECKLFIRSIDGVAIPKDLPDVAVTLQDSLDAGNCHRESERVAKWFTTEAVPSRALARKIQQTEPLLMPFALRAIKQAARRTA